MIDGVLGEEIVDELRMTLEVAFADQTNAWDLQPDGRWTRRPGDPRDPDARSLHRELMEYYRAKEHG